MTCSNTGTLPCTPLGFSFNSANNQITSTGYTYDAAGNLLSDNTHGYVYDAENRLTCVLGTDGTCTSYNAMLYLYDAQGQRVGKQQANTLEDYVYDPEGHISSVHDGLTNLLRTELYAGSRHVATWAPNPNGQYSDPYPSGLFYNHADWLGTERVRTTSSGTIYEKCTDTPYGMNLLCVGPDTSPMHFTGKQHDYESGLDNFGARYYGSSNALGRFMTPDWSAKAEPVPYAKLDNPQSLNLYAYADNNPLRFVDVDGHADVAAMCSGQEGPCNVTVNQTVNFIDENGKVTSTISLSTNFTVTHDDKGNISSVTTSATASNVSGVPLPKSELATIASTDAAIQKQGVTMGFGQNTTELLTALGVKESTMGFQSSTNPLQLSNGLENGDVNHNIKGGLDIFNWAGKRSNFSPYPTYFRYNGPQKKPGQQEKNAQIYTKIYSGIVEASTIN
jgi:RHS repeat-associated protein